MRKTAEYILFYSAVTKNRLTVGRINVNMPTDWEVSDLREVETLVKEKLGCDELVATNLLMTGNANAAITGGDSCPVHGLVGGTYQGD